MTSARESRLLGPVMSTAMVMGLIIGAGIFLLPASIAEFGANMFTGWAVTILGFLSLAFSFSLLAKRIDGGPYEYVKQAFGEQTAFLTNWSYLVSTWAGGAAVAVAFAGALGHAMPALAAPALVAPLAIVPTVILTIIASHGARSAGWAQVITTALKIMPLVLVILVAGGLAASGIESEPLAEKAVTLSDTGKVAAIMAFSLLGFEAAAYTADKTARAREIVPIATMLGTVLTGLLYVLACTAVVSLVPLNQLTSSTQPFADAITGSLGGNAGFVVALFVAISAVGALNASLVISGEIGFEMGRNGSAPPLFAHSNRHGMPAASLIASAVAVILLILVNSSRALADLFTFLVLLTTVSSLFLYAVVAVAALLQPLSWKARAVVIVALLFSLGTIYGAGTEALLWGLALLAAGWPIRMLSRRLSGSRGSTPPAAERPAAPPESAA